MEDLNKIILTWKNSSYLLMENPWAYEGMTAAEYEYEEKKANEYGIGHGSLDGYVPSWKKKAMNSRSAGGSR